MKSEWEKIRITLVGKSKAAINISILALDSDNSSQKLREEAEVSNVVLLKRLELLKDLDSNYINLISKDFCKSQIMTKALISVLNNDNNFKNKKSLARFKEAYQRDDEKLKVLVFSFNRLFKDKSFILNFNCNQVHNPYTKPK